MTNISKFKDEINARTFDEDLKADLTEMVRIAYSAGLNEACATRAWQPIDTAPKDGSWVLIAARNLHPCDAQWMKDEHQEGWMDIGGFFSTQPTHWQPLPNFTLSGENEK